jgi:hypothetical protein
MGQQWMAEVLSTPRNEFPEFPAGLSFSRCWRRSPLGGQRVVAVGGEQTGTDSASAQVPQAAADELVETCLIADLRTRPLLSVQRAMPPLATLRAGLTSGRLADNADMTMDSSMGALAPGETVAGEPNRRCA